MDLMKKSRLSRRGVFGRRRCRALPVGCAAQLRSGGAAGRPAAGGGDLRGAVDGLAMVPPHGDKDYAATRGALALAIDGATPLHDLDGMFGLHPALANMKSLYDAKELLVFQNICSPYRDRSHSTARMCWKPAEPNRARSAMAGSTAR